MVTLTETAAVKVQELAERKGAERPAGLRIRVADGGCSGLRYQLQFDDRAVEFDRKWEQRGVRILADETSAQYLEGATLDYRDGLNSSGFRIDNPNARSTCNCGDSFGT